MDSEPSPGKDPARMPPPARDPSTRLRSLAERFGLLPGEVAELLERLPYGELEGPNVPEVWRRPIARRAVEAYAARRRAVARLARRGAL
jgi:hypothetical protein